MSELTPREWRFYIDDMISFAGKVITYTDGLDQERFVPSGLNYDATVRNLELIGEAATHVPDAVRAAHPQATALYWKPQLALLVKEQTLLPVLMTLAPALTLAAKFSDELAAALSRHGASQEFIERELAAMTEVAMCKTTNRSVVGTMNEFSFMAEGYREYPQPGRHSYES